MYKILFCFQKKKEKKNHDPIRIINPSISKIVLKLDQLIPNFTLIFNSMNRGLFNEADILFTYPLC